IPVSRERPLPNNQRRSSPLAAAIPGAKAAFNNSVSKRAQLQFRHFVMIVFGLATTAGVTKAAAANNDDPNRPRIYDARFAELPLQPFILDTPAETKRAIRVAYYAPRPILHAEPSYRGEQDD